MASNDTPKTILLKGKPIQYEAVAAAAIDPGDLIMVTSTGAVQRHNAAAGVAEAAFAREQEWAGGGISTPYALNDRVPYLVCSKGDEVYAFLQDEGNVAAGAFLESDGLGSLKATTHAITNATTAAAWPIAMALEAVNNTGGTGKVRIKVRIL